MKSLFDLLRDNNKIPMHMPGHKRNVELAPYLKRLAADLDITEIDGFDDLHNPEGILVESMKRAANFRGADKAFYLVNGSTCGILAGICAVLKDGDKVICARNCHKSVYNALEMVNADVVFIRPEVSEESGICGSVLPEEISAELEKNPDCKLIILTSPTYEGIVSDVKAICEVAHSAKVPVLVDAAHGAHFGFSGFPDSAVSCGADIAIESLHKALPSLTQTAICYVQGQLVDSNAILEKLAVFETSSPSYLLMASIDECMNLLIKKGDILFENWNNILDSFYKRIKGLKNIGILQGGSEFFAFDRSKIVITGNGKKISELLRDRNIECEMAMPGYAVAMTGVGDTQETLACLLNALFEIDKFMNCPEKKYVNPPMSERVMTAKAAKNLPAEHLNYKDSIGRISAEYVWAYPPGVPIIIPGERVTLEAAKCLSDFEDCGFSLKGGLGRKEGKILVIK